jgi:hypothetical protein
MRCPQCNGRLVREQLGTRSYYSSDILRDVQCETMIPEKSGTPGPMPNGLCVTGRNHTYFCDITQKGSIVG